MTAAMLVRHKCGDNVDDLVTHASKQEANMGGEQQMKNSFGSLLLCDVETLDSLLTNRPAFLKGVV